MTWMPEFCRNRATEIEIAAHLSRCDGDFATPLSSRIDISEYAHKIHVAAVRFEAWAENSLAGLVAVYCNDTSSRFAYITSVSVLPEFQGNGIATQLMGQCIAYLRQHGIEYLELEVDSRNAKAIHVYERFGFITTERRAGADIMGRNLGRKL